MLASVALLLAVLLGPVVAQDAIPEAPAPFETRVGFVPTPADAPFLAAKRAGAAAADADQLGAWAVGARPGQVVADIGAGDGRHVVALAQAVGAEGRVFATELDETRLGVLGGRAREAGVDNVIPVHAAPDDVGLPEASVDVALLSDVFQFVRVLDGKQGQDKRAFLASLARSLVPGGVVVVTYVTSSLMKTDAERDELLSGTIDDFAAAGFLPGRRWLFTETGTWPHAVLEFGWAGPVDEALPPGRIEYMGRPVALTMSAAGAAWLVRDTRQEEEDSDAFLRALDVPKGGVIADVGCGVGYHTLPIARLAGEDGRVLGVDIQPQMLEYLVQRTRDAGLTNIVPVLGTPADPRLPPASCDLILMADTWHEVSHPERLLARVKAALRPGGRLALLEFRLEDDDVPIKVEHRMAATQVRREMEAGGFRLAGSYDELPIQHLLFFERDEG